MRRCWTNWSWRRERPGARGRDGQAIAGAACGNGEGGMGAPDRWSTPIRPKRPRRVSKRNFYTYASLTEAERIELKKAAKVEDLGDEIAMLRVRLKAALEKPDEDLGLIVRGMETLIKAVAAQYRLSPRSKKDLSDNFPAVFNSLGDHILPVDR